MLFKASFFSINLIKGDIVIRREIYTKDIIKAFSVLSAYIEGCSRDGLYDINKFMEDSFIEIANIFFGGNYRNLNIEKYNHPAIDLGCRASRVAIQVTSSISIEKIRHTMSLFERKGYLSSYDKVIFIHLSMHKKRIRSSEEIIDLSNLVNMISSLNNDNLERLHLHVKKEFGSLLDPINEDNDIKFNQNRSYEVDDVSDFLEFNKDWVEDGLDEEHVKYGLNGLRSMLEEMSPAERDVVLTVLLRGKSKDFGCNIGISLLKQCVQNSQLKDITDSLCERDIMWVDTEDRVIGLYYNPHKECDLSDFNYFFIIKEYLGGSTKDLEDLIMNCDFRVI